MVRYSCTRKPSAFKVLRPSPHGPRGRAGSGGSATIYLPLRPPPGALSRTNASDVLLRALRRVARSPLCGRGLRAQSQSAPTCRIYTTFIPSTNILRAWCGSLCPGSSRLALGCPCPLDYPARAQEHQCDSAGLAQHQGLSRLVAHASPPCSVWTSGAPHSLDLL
ncbi:hypothetical protein BC628DRAFT_705547 [Trametes gibbosa]|nr:hypothetical protein BC628DRAFT_705547 [Trametes gibbosa]